MPDILSKSTIVVLPSYREGMPKSLLEAAASGRPVVTTNIPGCRDAIIENSTGVLVRYMMLIYLHQKQKNFK